MAKLDFPAASSSPWIAPNGVTYTYIGTEPNGHWSGTEADGSISLESKFVEITGDDMSGDLTLGTNKITLNATTGSITAADSFTGKGFYVDTLATNGGVNISAGKCFVRQDGGNPVFSVVQGDANTVTAEITGNGNITAAGKLLVGTTTEGAAVADNLTIADSGNVGITLRSGASNAGAIYFSNATSGDGEFDGYIQYEQNNRQLRFGTASTSRMIIDSSGNITAAGSGTFGNSPTGNGVSVYPSGGLLLRKDDAGKAIELFSGGTANTDRTFSVDADGSATFAGVTTVDAGVAEEFIRLAPAGNLQVRRATKSAAGTLWQGYGAGDITSQINSDGSATFKGSIASSMPVFTGPTDATTEATSLSLKASGPGLNTAAAELRVGRYSGVDANAKTKLGFYLRDTGESPDAYAEVLRLNGNGSGEFVSSLSFNTNGTRSDGSNSLVGYNQSKVVSCYVRASGTAYFKGNVTSDGTIGFNLEADDDTKYTTTTDSEGNETRVYNGAVLNVKDRLQKADAALQSLKTAAAASTDFASLKSAIATALADI